MENEKLLLSGLVVTQNALRNIEQIGGMMQHIINNGRWTKDALTSWGGTHNNLISIVQFSDGVKGIHDGHHRCVATLLGGRNYLYPSEYELCHRSYADYMCVNLDAGWITPFDPRTEVRLGNFLEFKDFVYELLEKDVDAAMEYIVISKYLYACARDIQMLSELVKLYINFLDDKL